MNTKLIISFLIAIFLIPGILLSQFVQQGPKLVGTNHFGSALMGSSVAISGDGNTVIAGGPGDNSSAGAVWVFTRSAGVWTQLGQKLVGTGGIGVTTQGVAVAISSDGNTAIVGGQNDNSFPQSSHI